MKIGRRVFPMKMSWAMKMFWIVLAILAVALSIWGATRSAAVAVAEEFSVWWSPKLEVDAGQPQPLDR